MSEDVNKANQKGSSIDALFERAGAKDELSAERFVLDMLKRSEGEFEETLFVRADGSFEPTKSRSRGTGMDTVPSVFGLADTPEGLRQIARKIQKQFPEISFSFAENVQRTEFTYKVTLK